MTDAVEKVARLLDPQSWRVMDQGLASMLRKHKGQDIGYDPENFKHPQSIKRANEIIDTLKFLGWLSPADLAARDAEVTRAALEMVRKNLQDDFGFHDYTRDELTKDFGQPRFDLFNNIMQTILALTPHTNR